MRRCGGGSFGADAGLWFKLNGDQTPALRAELVAAYPDAVVGTATDLGAVDLLQRGTRAGVQWSHLCGGF